MKTDASLEDRERDTCRFRFSADRDQNNSANCIKATLVQDLVLNILDKDGIGVQTD